MAFAILMLLPTLLAVLPTATAQSPTLTIIVKYRAPGTAFVDYSGQVVTPDDELQFDVSLTNAGRCTSTVLNDKDATWDITTSELSFWHTDTSDNNIVTGTGTTVTGSKSWSADETKKDQSKTFTITAKAQACGTGYTTPGDVTTSTPSITFDTWLPDVKTETVVVQSGKPKVKPQGVAELPWSNNGDPDFDQLTIVSSSVSGKNLGATFQRSGNKMLMTIGANPDAVDGNVPVEIRFADPEGNEKPYTWQVPVDTIVPVTSNLKAFTFANQTLASWKADLAWDSADPDGLSAVAVQPSTVTTTDLRNTRITVTDAPTSLDTEWRVRLTDEAGNQESAFSDAVRAPNVKLTPGTLRGYAGSEADPVLFGMSSFFGSLALDVSRADFTGIAPEDRIAFYASPYNSSKWLGCYRIGSDGTVTDTDLVTVASGFKPCRLDHSESTNTFLNWSKSGARASARFPEWPGQWLVGFMVNTTSGQLTYNYTFNLDPERVVVDYVTEKVNPTLAARTIQQHVDNVTVQVAMKDHAKGFTGINNITLEMRDGAGSTPQDGYRSTRAIVKCWDPAAGRTDTAECWGTRTFDSTTGKWETFRGKIAIPKDVPLKLGDYRVRVYGYDRAGNENATLAVAESGNDHLVKVRPRGFVPQKSAWIDDNNVFTGSTWAGYSNLTYRVGSQDVQCLSASNGYLCPVKHVRYYAWNPSQNAYDTSPFLTTTQRVGGAQQAANGAWYYNYTDSVTLTGSLLNLNPFKFKSEIVVDVPKPGGGSHAFTTEIKDLFAQRAGVPDLTINFPKEWAVNVSESAREDGSVIEGDVVFNATITFGQWEALFGSGDSRKAPYALWYLEDLNKKDAKKFIDAAGAYHASAESAKDASAVPEARRNATGTYCKNHDVLCPSTEKVITPRFAYNFSADLHRALELPQSQRKAPDVPANVWKNNFTLAAGEYVLHVEVYNPAEQTADGQDKFLTRATRPFAVDSRQPAVAVDYATKKTDGSPATQVVRGDNGFDWVKREFDVMVYAESGMGNFTGDPTVALKRKTVLPGQSLWLNVGFTKRSDVTRYDCGIACSFGNATRFINGTVTLPASDVEHGRGFDLYFNFTTDLRQNNSVTSVKVATGPTVPNEFSVHLDEAVPTTRMDARVNETGFSGTFGPGCWDVAADRQGARCMLYGRVTDGDSGVGRVDLRIRKAGTGSYWVHDLGGWCTNCESTAWFRLSASNLVHYEANGTWWRYGGAAFRLNTDQFTDYIVEARATDKVANAESVKTFKVRYDALAPVIEDLEFKAEGGNALPTDVNSNVPFVSWQGRRAAGAVQGVSGGPVWLFANVTDDACVAAMRVVVENGTTGALVGKYPVPHPLSSNGATSLTPAQCRTLGSSAKAVRLAGPVPAEVQSLAGSFENAPLLRTYLEVVDARQVATNKTGKGDTAQLVKSYYKVYDDYPARIADDRATWTPGTAAQGGVSTLTVYVFENVGVHNVTARIYRVEDNTYDASKPLATVEMAPDEGRGGVAANGTGWYKVTNTDANLTLVKGEYSAHVVARDLEGRGIEKRPIRLKVSDSAPPAVDLVAPAQATAFVNATPHVYAVAYSLNLTADGISVSTGDSEANLTDVPGANVVVREEKNLQNKTAALHVWHNATIDANASTFVVRVTARDLAGLADSANATFDVDRDAPVVNASFVNAKDVNGTVVLNAQSRLVVNATDELSGVADVTCRVDEGAAFNCGEPVTLAAPDGNRTVTVTAVDNVGNAGELVSLNVTLDKTPPTVSVASPNLTFIVTVEDTGTGVDVVTVHHSSEASAPGVFTATTAERLTGNAYRAILPEGATWYYVQAKDEAGNVKTFGSADAPKRIGEPTTPDGGTDPGDGGDPDEGEAPVNTPPALTVLAPTNGATLSGTVSVRWETTDADGDAVEITLAYEDASGKGGLVQRNLAGSAGAFSWDTSTIPDGTYTLKVRASDGTEAVEETVKFTLKKKQTVTPRTQPRPIVNPGEQLPIAVDVDSSKPVKVVRVELYKDGQRVQSLALQKQPGSENAYGITLEPAAPGTYLPQIVVEYQDGTTEEPVRLNSFTVATASGGEPVDAGFAFTLPLGLLLSVSVLTIGLAAWAGFVRWKP